MASVCIICHNETPGEAVADTTVIRTIRNIKTKLHMATNNVLVVCPDCRLVYDKRRKAYEGKLIMHCLLGLGLVVLVVGLPLLTGSGFNPLSIVFVLVLAGLVASLSMLDYMPPLVTNEPAFASASQLPTSRPTPSAAWTPRMPTPPILSSTSRAPPTSTFAPRSSSMAPRPKPSVRQSSAAKSASKSKSKTSRRGR